MCFWLLFLIITIENVIIVCRMSMLDVSDQFHLVDICNLFPCTRLSYAGPGNKDWHVLQIRNRWWRDERGLYRCAGCSPIERLFLNYQVPIQCLLQIKRLFVLHPFIFHYLQMNYTLIE